MGKKTFLMMVFAVIFAGCSGPSEQKMESADVEESTAGEETVGTSYNFDEGSFTFGFTGYAAQDKSYAVTGITFEEFTVSSPENKLDGTSIEVKLASVNSSADKNNGKGGEWSDIMIPARDENIVNGFINNLAQKETATAKVVGVDDSKIDLEVTLNDVTKVVEMPYTVTDGVLTAKGSTDVAEYNGNEAFKKFAMLCTAFHYGKSWSDIELTFSMNVQ